MADGAELSLLPSLPTLVELLGGSAATERAREAYRRAAATVDPAAIVAEPGLDVKAVARAIHDGSLRRDGPFVIVDCAIPDAVALEQQIFASAAQQGTLALVNLDELPAPLQARLARVLRDGQIDVDASGSGVAYDVRVLAAVCGEPDEAVQQGMLRRDLWTRFGLRLDVPALRQRSADIPLLVGCLVGDAAASARLPVPRFSREALMLLSALPWRRNFDELREVLDVLVRAVVGGVVRLEEVLDHVALEPVAWSQGDLTNLREARLSFERHYIAKVLSRHRGRMEDAARSLGMQRTNLYRKVRQLGIGVPRTRQP